MAKNDETIKLLMAKVAEQKEALGNKPRVSWRTNGLFKFNDQASFNLNAVREEALLVEALAFILGKSQHRIEASKMLGVAAPKFEFNGYSMTDWFEDFKTRLSVLAWEAKKKQLDATEEKLSTLISEEARTETELDNITKSLGL